MYGRRLLLTLIASAAIHAAFVLLAPKHAPPAPHPYKERPRPVAVSVQRQAQKRAEAAPAAEPRKEPEPKPEPRKAPEPKPEAPKPPPKEAPPPPKAEAPPPPPAAEPPAPKKPAPMILSNVALNGGVAVQTGSSSNLFGDPTKDAAGFAGGRDAPRTGGDGTGTGSGNGTAAPRKVVVRPPEAMNSVKGVYPEAQRDLGRVVRVELLLTVNAGGEVVDVSVRNGFAPAFDEEAKRTVRKLRFRPATRDGVPIPYEVKWTVVFLPEG